MSDLHDIQMLILRELLFAPNSKFSELNIKGLTSDHFSYHINALIELGYVTKKNLRYSLTTKGKEYANQMDTDENHIEKQPKIAVIIVCLKEENEQKLVLIQERTKEPFFGYKGFITGKIRFGEKVLETARRELKEEAGLECDSWGIKKIVHNHVRHQETGELLEDKIFYIITANNPSGELINTRNGKNNWKTEEEYYNLEKKYYDEDSIFKYAKLEGHLDFPEETFFINEF